MKKKCLLTLAAACLCLAPLRAQTLRSEGPVPADLRTSLDSLYRSDLRRAEDYVGGRVRHTGNLRRAAYHTGKIMASGRVLYGDELTRMVERVADTLLAGQPELRRQLRFYVVKSPDVNAYTTPQGIVFVNVGLVAQVENEAQLAFVLSHEIVHYCRDHGLEELVGRQDKKRRRDEAELGEEQAEVGEFLRRHSRSRQMENEADSLGIAMFYARSPYATAVVDGVFDVLQYSELPFDDIPFDTTFFNTPHYRLSGVWLDSVADITSRDNYDDSRSTHPNILTRRTRCAALLAGRQGGADYVVTTRADFERLRHMARLECVRQELIHTQYSRAFYNAWLLAQGRDGADEQLCTYMAQALYGVAMFKNHMSSNSVTGDYKEVEGESQQVYYALRKMSAEQTTLAALHKVWQWHRQFPANGLLASMAGDLMDELRTSLGKSEADFAAEPPSAAPADTAATDAATSKTLTKYERIRQKRQSQTRRNQDAYALTDLMATDSAFASQLRDALGGKARPVTAARRTDDGALLVFDPTYWVVDYDLGDQDAAKSDRRERRLTERIARTATRFGMEVVDYSDHSLQQMTTADQYNDFVTVCEWTAEFWQTRGQFAMRRLSQRPMDSLMVRHGARYLNMTAVLNLEHTPSGTSPQLFLVVPLAPVVLAGMLTGLEHTAMVSVLVDVSEGRLLAEPAYNSHMNDHDALIDAMLYDGFHRALRHRESVGFLGHRLALAGGVQLGLSGYTSIKADRPLALAPWASAEFVVAPSFSLALWARYQPGYKGAGRYTILEDRWNSAGRYLGTVEKEGPYKSKNMTTLGLAFRYYLQTRFAPLGTYLGAGLHWVRMTEMDNDPAASNTIGVGLGIGRNYILFDRLLLNWQINYAYTYGFHLMTDFDLEGGYNDHYGDAALSHLFTLGVGLGVLPF